MDILASVPADHPHAQIWEAKVRDFSRPFRQARETALRERWGLLGLPPEGRAALFQDVYKDILVTRLYGVNAIKQPFAYLDGTKDSTLGPLLSSRNPRTRAMVVLHMPEDSRRTLLRTMDLDAKLKLMQEIVGINTFSPSELESTDSEIKSESGSSGGESTVAALPLLPGVLSDLNTFEETRILAALNAQSSESLAELRATGPSLGFLRVWKDEVTSLVLAQASSDEVLALIRTIPEAQERILGDCSPRARQIVTEDLSAADRTSAEDKASYLGVLRDRLRNLLDEGDVLLSDAFVSGGATGQAPQAPAQAA